MRLIAIPAAALLALAAGCGDGDASPPGSGLPGAVAPSSSPVTPPQPGIDGRAVQSTDGKSNAETAGSGSQLPDAGTRGTNGVADPERAREPDPAPEERESPVVPTPAQDASDPHATH